MLGSSSGRHSRRRAANNYSRSFSLRPPHIWVGLARPQRVAAALPQHGARRAHGLGGHLSQRPRSAQLAIRVEEPRVDLATGTSRYRGTDLTGWSDMRPSCHVYG
jgi:hypothetical protein